MASGMAGTPERGSAHADRVVAGSKEYRPAGSGALRLVSHQLEHVGHSAEFGKRTSLHLLHRPAAMHLHRRFGDADIVGNLFAQAAARHLNYDLALPGAQGGEALPKGDQVLVILPPRTIAGQAKLNGIEKILVAERLGEELDRTPLHCLHRHRDVAMARDEDDRDLPVCRSQLALEIEAALAGQSDIEHQASGAIRWIGLEEVGNGGK